MPKEATKALRPISESQSTHEVLIVLREAVSTLDEAEVATEVERARGSIV